MRYEDFGHVVLDSSSLEASLFSCVQGDDGIDAVLYQRFVRTGDPVSANERVRFDTLVHVASNSFESATFLRIDRTSSQAFQFRKSQDLLKTCLDLHLLEPDLAIRLSARSSIWRPSELTLISQNGNIQEYLTLLVERNMELLSPCTSHS